MTEIAWERRPYSLVRKLTYKEVVEQIEEENMCGVNTLVQDLFAMQDSGVQSHNIEVIGDFNEQGEILSVEVVEKKKWKHLQ